MTNNLKDILKEPILFEPKTEGNGISKTTVYETTVTRIDAISGPNSQIGQTRVQICNERCLCRLESKFAPYWYALIPATVISYTVDKTNR